MKEHTLKKTDFSQKLSITDSFLALDETSCPLLPSILGFCLARVRTGLELAVIMALSSYVQLLCGVPQTLFP